MLDLIISKAEGTHVPTDQADGFDRVGEWRLARVAQKCHVLGPDSLDRITHPSGVHAEQWGQFVEGEVEMDARLGEPPHLVDGQVHEWAERMVHKCPLEAQPLDLLSERPELGVTPVGQR